MNKFFDKLYNFFLPKTFSYHYNKGLEFLKFGDLEKSIEFFELAMTMPDKEPVVLYNLGLAHQKSENFGDAIIYYQSFLNHEPEDYDALYNLGLAYYENAVFSKAVETFEKCLNIKKDMDNYKALTLSYVENNQIDNAIEIAEKLFEDYDKNKSLIVTIAKAVESKNKTFNKSTSLVNKAIELYLKMIEKNPKDVDAYLALSIAYAKKGAWDLAVKNCLMALEIEPKSSEINNQMGLIYYCNDKLDDAIIYYEESLKIKETSKTYSNLAYAYEKIGKLQKAIETFKRLLEKYPNIKAKEEIENHIRILQS